MPSPTTSRPGSTPPYLSRIAISAARVPAVTTSCTLPGEQLEVDVPDPRDVAAVGDAVVQGQEQLLGPPVRGQRADQLVRARRGSWPAGGRRRGRPPAAARSGRRRRRTARGRRRCGRRRRRRRHTRPPPRRARCRRCRGPASAARRPRRRSACAARTGCRRGPAARPCRPRRRAAAAAARSPGSSTRPDGRGRRARSASRVPHAGHHFESLACCISGERRARVVDAEREGRAGVAERGEQRIVAVSDEVRGGRHRRRHLLPAGGDRLELAVAVELVAEQVAEHRHPRPQAAAPRRAAPPRRPRRRPGRRPRR